MAQWVFGAPRRAAPAGRPAADGAFGVNSDAVTVRAKKSRPAQSSELCEAANEAPGRRDG